MRPLLSFGGTDLWPLFGDFWGSLGGSRRDFRHSSTNSRCLVASWAPNFASRAHRKQTPFSFLSKARSVAQRSVALFFPFTSVFGDVDRARCCWIEICLQKYIVCVILKRSWTILGGDCDISLIFFSLFRSGGKGGV